MRILGRILTLLLTSCSLLAALLILATAYSPLLNPTIHPRLSCLGLAFPLCALACGCLLALCLIVQQYRRALIPLLALVLCLPQLRTYCPINIHVEKTDELGGKETLTLLSYNVMNFDGGELDSLGQHPILTYLQQSGADIICLQEFAIDGRKGHITQKLLSQTLGKLYPYNVVVQAQKGKGTHLACYSRLPILAYEHIDYVSDHNGSISITMDWGGGDTLTLINNHLETNRLTTEDKTMYEDMLRDPERSKVKESMRVLIDKLGQAAAIRAAQADSVASIIDRRLNQADHHYIITCGDLNDSPISYAHRRLTHSLNDAYALAGNGPGISYNRNKLFLRIDHIFTDKRLNVKTCQVDRSIRTSDHFPIKAVIARP